MQRHTIDRSIIIADLGTALRAQPWILAAWLGGSAANNRFDEYSDIDLVCMVEDHRVEATFDLLRKAAEELSPIDLEFRVPSPTWHGHEQAFWRLRDADPHHLLDIVVIKRSASVGQRFLETERHGTPEVLFDREGLVKPAPFDRQTHNQKMRARFERISVTFPLYQPLVTRAVARDQPCDAAYFYMQFTVLPTVEMARMRHCPDRFDFGMRYLRDDLSRGVYEQICRLALPGGLAGLAKAQQEAERLFAALKSEIVAAPPWA